MHPGTRRLRMRIDIEDAMYVCPMLLYDTFTTDPTRRVVVNLFSPTETRNPTDQEQSRTQHADKAI